MVRVYRRWVDVVLTHLFEPVPFLGRIALALAHHGGADIVVAVFAAFEMGQELICGRDGGHNGARGGREGVEDTRTLGRRMQGGDV